MGHLGDMEYTRNKGAGIYLYIPRYLHMRLYIQGQVVFGVIGVE
jgi:hypothetical protein